MFRTLQIITFKCGQIYLHKLEVLLPTLKPLGLVAQSCNSATGGQGYLDSAGHLGL